MTTLLKMAKVALLVVDVQYDFLPPDGALAVDKGDEILPVVYRLLENDRWASVVMSEARTKGSLDVLATKLTLQGFLGLSSPATHFLCLDALQRDFQAHLRSGAVERRGSRDRADALARPLCQHRLAGRYTSAESDDRRSKEQKVARLKPALPSGSIDGANEGKATPSARQVPLYPTFGVR